MRIERIETFIMHVPVTGNGIADSTNQITHWGVPGVVLFADNGLKGYGYTGTHALLSGDQLITDFIANIYGPLLLGENATDVKALWKKLYHYPAARWIGRAGVSQLALACIDVALWDLKAKAANLPLWKLLSTDPMPVVEAYNTECGWLNIPMEQLIEGCKKVVDQGFKGIKVKVGHQNPEIDMRRIAAVREAVGSNVRLMIDVNGKWDVNTARKYAAQLNEFNLFWIEEPLWFDDLEAHKELASFLQVPIALGEQLYSECHFDSFMASGAVDFVQVDAVRVAGITEWWSVADKAHAKGLPVVPHVGDMMNIHLQTCLAHPASTLLEYIPWLRHCFEEPATVETGVFKLPEKPGAGTTFRPEAMREFSRPLH
jgi:L-alanine-DL-glutamate epimerase-like enolase superfamily enzyme